MKKILLPLILAVTLLLTACSPKIDPAIGRDGIDNYSGGRITLVKRNGTWHSKLFSMKYTGVDGDRENPGTFDPETDTMAHYMRQHGWAIGDKTLPDTVLEDAADWEVAVGNFGDDGSYEEVDIGFAGDNHGLMICTTFEIADLEEFKYTFNKLNLHCHYDNTVSIFLNGTLVYRHSIDESGTPDWTGGYEHLNTYFQEVNAYFIGDEALKELLVQGQNTLFAMVKDGWGGRVLVLGMDCN